MTQQDLVHASGVSLASVQRVESGEPCRIQTAIALLHAFDSLDDSSLVDAAASLELAPHVLSRKLDLHATRQARSVSARPPRDTPRFSPPPLPLPQPDVLAQIHDQHGAEGLRGALAALEAMTDRIRDMLDEEDEAARRPGLNVVEQHQRDVDGVPFVEETRRTYVEKPTPKAKPTAQQTGQQTGQPTGHPRAKRRRST
ncbi:MAG: hypothetical protein RIS45_386 [Planctomycetota bacterium]